MPFLVAPTEVKSMPVAAAAAPAAEAVWDPTGPYADGVIMKVITQDEVRIAEIISGGIDLLSDNIADVPGAVDELQAYDYINLTQTERLGWGHMTINCQRYPFSIPALRRALAYAMDKYEFSDIMWSGLGFPLDNPVPRSCGEWHNNHTTPDYRAPQVAAAKAELAAAGFVDLDGDGYVEAPNGERFVFAPMYSIEAPTWSAAVPSQFKYWNEAGIQVELTPIAFNTLIQLSHTIPRNYDAVCYGYGIDPIPLQLTTWTTDEISNPDGNIPSWSNETYDYYVNIMMTATDHDTVRQACWDAQQVFVQNVPIIVCYSNYEVNAYRNDKWENFVEIPGWGVSAMNRWVPTKVRLQEGVKGRDPATGCGGTFLTMIGAEIDTANPLMSGSVYGHYPLALVYPGLMGLNDPRTHQPTVGGGGLTTAWTITELADRYQFDFTIVDNATWHDGRHVTAEDVEFTYNYIAEKRIPAYIYNIQFLNSCTAIDDTHIQIISNGKSYWAFELLRDWGCLPKHIWEGIASPIPFANPQPVGFGPFTWYRRIEGEYIELRFWENYHYGVLDHEAGPEPTPSYLWLYVGVGALVIVVVLLGSVWYLRKK
jgi:ABC-type transport system substrate-binding protein